MPAGGAARPASLSAASTSETWRRPQVYTEESLLLIALLRTLWRLSYQDVHDWLLNQRRTLSSVT